MGLCVRQLVRPGLVCAVVAHAHRQHAIVTVGDEGAHCVGWGEGQVLGTGVQGEVPENKKQQVKKCQYLYLRAQQHR